MEEISINNIQISNPEKKNDSTDSTGLYPNGKAYDYEL